MVHELSSETVGQTDELAHPHRKNQLIYSPLLLGGGQKKLLFSVIFENNAFSVFSVLICTFCIISVLLSSKLANSGQDIEE